jgi:hypothetical protein
MTGMTVRQSSEAEVPTHRCEACEKRLGENAGGRTTSVSEVFRDQWDGFEGGKSASTIFFFV